MSALRVEFPDPLVRSIATAVADELERRGSTSAPASPYLNVSEAAQYLRCEPQRLYDLSSTGQLVALKEGRRLLYRRDQLDAYLRGDR